MGDEFPPNSRKVREGQQIQQTKKVERIVAGDVTRRKKPLTKRFASIFFGGDARSAWDFVTWDVLIPAIRETIADVFIQGVEQTVIGGRSRGRRGGGYGSRDRGGYTNYNRFSRDPRERDRPQMSSRGRARHDFDEIILETRHEAEDVIDQLFELVNKFNMVTVADLYDMVGISGNFVDDKWGWTDLRGAGVTRLSRGGYLLDLPRPEHLD
jgi:hypothetical protein